MHMIVSLFKLMADKPLLQVVSATCYLYYELILGFLHNLRCNLLFFSTDYTFTVVTAYYAGSPWGFWYIHLLLTTDFDSGRVFISLLILAVMKVLPSSLVTDSPPLHNTIISELNTFTCALRSGGSLVPASHYLFPPSMRNLVTGWWANLYLFRTFTEKIYQAYLGAPLNCRYYQFIRSFAKISNWFFFFWNSARFRYIYIQINN